jgi:hypothetical protein
MVLCIIFKGSETIKGEIFKILEYIEPDRLSGSIYSKFKMVLAYTESGFYWSLVLRVLLWWNGCNKTKVPDLLCVTG